MGVLCSTVDKEGDDPPEGKAQVNHLSPAPRRLRKMPQPGRPITRSQLSWRAAITEREFDTEGEYNKALERLQAAEKRMAFDAEVIADATIVEKRADALVQEIRAWERDHAYGKPYDAQGQPTGKRTEGEHFLGNVDLINSTELMEIARRMPKGAHLHIHFNSCLRASFLIKQARNIRAMYIRSTLPLTTPQNFEDARISFMVMTPYEATHVKDKDGIESEVPLGNVFGGDYVSNRWMSYIKFQRRFKLKDENGRILSADTEGAESWLERKMQISEEEAHGTRQTGRG